MYLTREQRTRGTEDSGAVKHPMQQEEWQQIFGWICSPNSETSVRKRHLTIKMQVSDPT